MSRRTSDTPPPLSDLERAMGDFAGVAAYEAKLGYTVALEMRYSGLDRLWYATARWTDAQTFGTIPMPIGGVGRSMSEALVELCGKLAGRNTSVGVHADRFTR